MRNTWPNKPDSVNPAIASQFHVGSQWRGVTDPERSVGMNVATKLLLLAIAIMLSACFRPSSPDVTAIIIDPDVPKEARNLSLRVMITVPLGLGKGRSFGHRSLRSPTGSGASVSGTNISFSEERLIAIKRHGFEMLFIKRENDMVETSVIVFPFGSTTATNALGWAITGAYD